MNEISELSSIAMDDVSKAMWRLSFSRSSADPVWMAKLDKREDGDYGKARAMLSAVHQESMALVNAAKANGYVVVEIRFAEVGQKPIATASPPARRARAACPPPRRNRL